MEKHLFGQTGMEVARLGIGLAEIGFELPENEESEAGRLLNMALDNGINFLDTAACYGISERTIGRTVSGRRDEYYLATKAGHSAGEPGWQEWTYRTIVDSVDRSLRLMNTDRLDLVQLHSCGIDVLEKGQVIKALQDVKTAGKTGHIGYSGDNEDAHWAVESGEFETLQTSFSIADQRARSTGLLKKAKDKGMGIILKRPIAGGSWQRARNSKGGGRGYDEPYLQRSKKMASEGPISGEPSDSIQFSLAFVFAYPEPDVAIVGTKNSTHLERNLSLIKEGISISEEAIKELQTRFDRLDDNWRQLT